VRSSERITIGAFVLSFFLVGIPFWQIPYSQVTVPHAFFGFGVVVVFSAAAFLAVRCGFMKGLLLPGLVFPAVLMARVIVEGIMDPSRHNLWPLALIIAAVLGLLVAGVGSALGHLVARMRGP
jgi:hypothetical protein